MAAPRNQRNNNPGNIRTNSTAWEGKVGDDGAFVTFATPAHGVRAMTKTLYSYQNKHNKKTVREIISRWAPPNENDTNNYVNTVAKEIGVNPDSPIDLRSDTALTQKMIRSMIRMEGGPSSVKYFESSISDGVGMANGSVTAPKPLPKNGETIGLDAFGGEGAQVLKGVGIDETPGANSSTSGTGGSDTGGSGGAQGGGSTGSSPTAQFIKSVGISKFENLADVLKALEENGELWENELDQYQNYSYNIEFFVVDALTSSQFLNSSSPNFESVINNDWPASGSNYITIAKTATTTEFVVDNLIVENLGDGSRDLNKLVGADLSLSFDLIQIGDSSVADHLISASLLMGYSSIAETVYYIKITFKGYDRETGDTSLLHGSTKVIPFMLINFLDNPSGGVRVGTVTDTTGTRIKLEGRPLTRKSTSHTINTVESQFTFKLGDTLEDCITDFIERLNEQVEENSSYEEGQERFLNTYSVVYDDTIKNNGFLKGKMISDKHSAKAASNNKVKSRTNSVNIAEPSGQASPGTSIIDILYDICIQSEEIRKALIKENPGFSDIVNISSEIIPKPNGFNPITGRSGNEIKYFISIKRELIIQNQFDQANKMSHATNILREIFEAGRCRKAYYYYYTGLNDQILDLTISMSNQLAKVYNTPKDSWSWFRYVKTGSTLEQYLTDSQRKQHEKLTDESKKLNQKIEQLSGESAQLANSIKSESKNIAQELSKASVAHSTSTNRSLNIDDIANQTINVQNLIEKGEIAKALQQFPDSVTELLGNIEEKSKGITDLLKFKNISAELKNATDKLKKTDISIQQQAEEQLGAAMSDQLVASQSKLQSNLNKFKTESGFILAEELGDDVLVSKLNAKEYGAVLDSLSLNPVAFKRAIIPKLLEQKKTRVFKVPDQEDVDLARIKFYEGIDADNSMLELSMTIKGDPFWSEYYLSNEQKRQLFQTNTSENFKNFTTNLNGGNYFILTVNKADDVDSFDNITIDEFEVFLYRVKTVINSFSGGMFTQTLTATREIIPRYFKDVAALDAPEITDGLSTLLDGKDGLGEQIGGIGNSLETITSGIRVPGVGGILDAVSDFSSSGLGFINQELAGLGSSINDIASGVAPLFNNQVQINVGDTNITIPKNVLTHGEMAGVSEQVNAIGTLLSGRNTSELSDSEKQSLQGLVNNIEKTVSSATSGARPDANALGENVETLQRLEENKTKLQTAQDNLDGFQLDPEQQKADEQQRQQLQQQILIDNNNAAPLIFDNVIQTVNPVTGEKEEKITVTSTKIDQPVILPAPPGALPTPSIDNKDGTMTVPVTNSAGDVISVSPEVATQLGNGNVLIDNIYDAIRDLPKKDVEYTWNGQNGQTETFTQDFPDWSKMPNLTYKDANGDTKTLTPDELGITSFTEDTGNTPDLYQHFVKKVADLYPDIKWSEKKKVDPENPGGPLLLESSFGSVLTPIESE